MLLENCPKHIFWRGNTLSFVSPEWIDDKSSDEEAYAEHHKQAIT